MPERFKFLVDAPPWKRLHIKAVSKFQGAAKAVFFPKEIPFKGEMGPPKSSILVNAPNSKPCLLAEWKGAGWEIFEQQWELMKQTFNLRTSASISSRRNFPRVEENGGHSRSRVGTFKKLVFAITVVSKS